MTGKPTETEDLTDADLDEIVATQYSESSSTDAPEPTVPVSPADEAVVTPAPDGADTAAAGDVDTATVAAAHPEQSASAPAVPAGKPFQFKATGGVHTLPGALELPDGSVVIPKEAQSDFRRVLASQRELESNFKQTRREFDRQLQQAKTQRTQKDVESDAVVQLFADIKKMSPEERWDYFNQFDAKVPELELEIKRQQFEQERKAFEAAKAGPAQSPEEQQERFIADLTSELDVEFQAIEKNPALAALTAAERQALRTRWSKNPARLARRAVADDPASGIKAGDTLFDPGELYEDVQFILANKPKPANGAAAQNAARNADQGNRIPPVVNGGKPPVGEPKRDTMGRFTDRKQFKKDLMRDDDEDAA